MFDWKRLLHFLSSLSAKERELLLLLHCVTLPLPLSLEEKGHLCLLHCRAVRWRGALLPAAWPATKQFLL